MSATKWVLTPLLVMVLATWTGTFAQAVDQGQAGQDRAISDQPLGPSPTGRTGTEAEIEIEHKDVDRSVDINGSRDVTIKREFEAEGPQAERRAAMRRDLQKEDSELRQWGEMQPAGPTDRGLAERAPATQPSAEMERDRVTRGPLGSDVDIFIFEEEPAAARGYWGPPSARGEIFGFQGESGPGQFYGYSDASRAVSSGVPAAVVHPAPEQADHSWRRGRNLVDDNLIQTRDEFKVDRDFYTKEWKVSSPPLVAHPRFHTIYDNELTQRYYSPWHGSPVVWAANMMTPIPLPQTRNQLYSSRQLWTYFDMVGRDNISNTPTLFGSRTGWVASDGLARRGPMQADIYAYEGTEPRGGMVSRDGAFFSRGQVMYYDDQDLMGPALGGGAMGGDILGYVSPEAEAGTITIGRGVSDDANLHLNIPRSTGVSIYGVPSAGGAVVPEGEIRTETEVYGYVGEEDWDAKRESRKLDEECK